ncbi:MAG: hypothetical protein ACKPKO_54075, partial [Candidatus Fonsibacter sp.]
MWCDILVQWHWEGRDQRRLHQGSFETSERANVARVSERAAEPIVAPTFLVVDISEAEEIEYVRRYKKPHRMIMQGISPVGGDTPRGALITAIREQYKHCKNWRANRVR